MRLSNLTLKSALGVMLVALIYQKTIKPTFTDNDSWVAEANAREERLNQELQPILSGIND